MAEDYGVYSYIAAKYTIPYKKQQIHCSVGGLKYRNNLRHMQQQK